MDELQIAVIVGTTRPGRNGRGVAEWLTERAQKRPAARYDLVDIADFALPLLDEPVPALAGRYQHAHTKAWSETVGRYDGFVFVTPEYNHSTSAALKNALDYLYAEWNDKAAAFVSYGTSNGTRAIEHLRTITSELQIAHIREQLSFNLFTDFTGRTTFTPGDRYDAQTTAMLDHLEGWTDALRSYRRHRTTN